MAGLKKDNLSDSLLQYLEGLGLSEEQVQQLIDNTSGDLSALQTTDKSSLVAAINELFQNANNGKELIATAIGEPLVSTDTFSAMSNGIDNLNNQFKSALMNNGVSVEAEDKFKSLIEKLSGLADSEGKGIQYANGTGSWSFAEAANTTIMTNLDFTPTIVICKLKIVVKLNSNSNSKVDNNGFLSTDRPYVYPYQYSILSIENITSDSFDVKSSRIVHTSDHIYTASGTITAWYAIGVGEEDTTFRDSLASILVDEGVEVTDTDDMVTLITKVDTEFTNNNNEIQTNRDRLYNLMLEGGYEVTSNMTIDDMMSLLEISGITCDEIKQIACGDAYTFILKNDGSVWSCGYNGNGKLGLGDTTDRTTFTQVTTNINNDAKQIACGYSHTFILKNDGSVWSCGLNSNGQLGLGDTATRYTFTQVTTNINNDVKQVDCGLYHTFILKNDGSIWSCGLNSNGQLGLGNTTARKIFTQVTTNINNDVKQIVCGYIHTFILKNDGSVWSCGRNDYGQLGLGNTTTRNTFTQIPKGLTY